MLFLQREPDGEALTGVTEDDRFNGIRCPKCQWQPESSSRWLCSHCECSWNTFDTRGKCPRCSFQWLETMCLHCHKWSLHEDWYELRGGQPT